MVHSARKLLGAALLAAATLGLAFPAMAQVSVSVTIAPPVIPVYAQPPVPASGYLWTPGYWAWNGAGYYWIPGAWVLPPAPGYLWTPPWWAWNAGLYVFNPGYWAPRVGYYGGINYGYGYGGSGYSGGYWQGRSFFYNRSVNNIRNVTIIRNVYDKTVINNVHVTRISYNGGPGGVRARPTARYTVVPQGQRRAATAAQRAHREQAARDRTRWTPAPATRRPLPHRATPPAPRREYTSPGRQQPRIEQRATRPDHIAPQRQGRPTRPTREPPRGHRTAMRPDRPARAAQERPRRSVEPRRPVEHRAHEPSR
ncbi:MAG TPA: hypothetical protein VFQ88_00015 [Nevskiaceae bacterium]|nr:hypothetical protein [Nevskiaceae bacterium]